MKEEYKKRKSQNKRENWRYYTDITIYTILIILTITIIILGYWKKTQITMDCTPTHNITQLINYTIKWYKN